MSGNTGAALIVIYVSLAILCDWWPFTKERKH
jgi:hypothetical protein